MSFRLKFILFISSVIAAVTAAATAWSISVALAVLCAALAGGLLASLLFDQRRRATSLAHLYIDDASPISNETHPSALTEAMLDGMREGMLVVDDRLRVIASNRAAKGMLGQLNFRSADVRLSDLTRHPAIHAAFTHVLNRNEQTETKLELQGPGGSAYNFRVVPLYLGRGRTGAIGMFFDITRLERLERVRQEFLSNVSHELRTPLTAIIAFVETLENHDLDDQQSSRRFLSIIRRSADRMQALIDDILELSAIEAGRVQVSVEPISLRVLVQDVLSALSSRAQARRITLTNDVANGAIVVADSRRLEQMLTNLVHNAIKFNREGGSVTVSHLTGARDRIEVRDTGEGIPAEHIARIFERFYRVDRARSRELGGTGLGLAIVKHLARAHGGEVSVQSRIGEGSTFVIELPADQTRQDRDSFEFGRRLTVSN